MESRKSRHGKPMTRRSFLRLGLQAAGGMIASGVLAGFYARFGERFWYKTNRLTLSFVNLPAAFDGMRIVQFSDVHHGRDFETPHVEAVARRIQALEPDMICFTGDLFDRNHGELTDACTPILEKLHAPFGKWAVLGNHDYGLNARGVAAELQKAGFTVLDNEHRVIEKSGERIWLAGVTDMIYGKPSMDEALRDAGERGYTLLLSHAPDYADIAVPYGVDLQLSGHSHGGQVRLPFVGALFTPEGAKTYIEGLYDLDGGRMKLYTNRGLGTSVLPVRFMCRPEITVITLKRG
ncbi:metallophosphoesterase [Paenibacillus contaminans]|uniref:Metallophosphoesterase n=1 Tax=Paenibacillus contaminans TaxID=450362 RepID=A0A329MK25_9BACL|nr:metallophosphoesterase [Paenibacillus contaminans]RAV20199.1 metallophosphoesterase [Paenibacillus contaminans]